MILAMTIIAPLDTITDSTILSRGFIPGLDGRSVGL